LLFTVFPPLLPELLLTDLASPPGFEIPVFPDVVDGLEIWLDFAEEAAGLETPEALLAAGLAAAPPLGLFGCAINRPGTASSTKAAEASRILILRIFFVLR
jgi:hypothetical protein